MVDDDIEYEVKFEPQRSEDSSDPKEYDFLMVSMTPSPKSYYDSVDTMMKISNLVGPNGRTHESIQPTSLLELTFKLPYEQQQIIYRVHDLMEQLSSILDLPLDILEPAAEEALKTLTHNENFQLTPTVKGAAKHDPG